ncbi:hypothetical protein QBC40DRAFT_188426 [Triangularia verruculosa]|uniref:Ankyrin repeat protein n=1 Tax=Triangularia verruculosa TaxID=2587418 RepID=A0AAN6X590_9PEZI|nr:hypothetical protein QBC40DRAFT_188426 [Triangularia verruculosa]
MNPRAKKYQFTTFSIDPSDDPDVQGNHSGRLQTVVEEPSGSLEDAAGSASRPPLQAAKRSSQTLSRVTWATLPPVNLEHAAGDKTIAIFMPYLAYESHDGRKRMAAMINRVNDDKNRPLSHRESALIDGYIHAQDILPLHCRRTLDQYSYYMLETTERRDKDQVVYRWATKHGKPKNAAPILMVDQLWLWVLPDGTVITCMPNTEKPSEQYNIKKLLSREIETNKARQAIQSPDSLVDMILKTCLNIMTRQGPGGVKLQEAFQSSINTIAEDEAVKMKRLLKTVDKLANAKDPFKYTSDIDSFSRISDESRQLVEIIDIQDELGIIKSILTTQLKVLEEFQGHIRPRKRSGGSKEHYDEDEDQGTRADKRSHHGTGLKNARVVDEAIRIVEDNLIRVSEMDESAKRVEAELKQLLQFKQQQASGWDTRYAMKLSEQGSRQNTIMVVFTIVTVIFLPLSFIASFFTIGIVEFPKNEETGEVDWPVHEVSKYLFPISVGVSAAILLCIGVVFYRMASKAKKRMDSAQRPPPSKWQALKQPNTRKHTHKHRRKQDDDYSFFSDCTSEIYDGEFGNARRRDDDDSSDEEWDDMSIDDENDYAPIFRRWRFHTHVPGLRKLWLWKLYPVSKPPAHHHLNKAQEDFEWDYPLRRWRDVTTERATLFIQSWKADRKDKNVQEAKHRHGPDDDECFSEDERHRSQTEEVEHRERVEERKDWLRDWLGLSWAKKKQRGTGDEPEDVDEDGARSTRSEKGIGRLFRRRGNREERWDEEMGPA